MEIRKLTAWQEWLESDRIIATAFLHNWDQKKSEEEFKAQASGEKKRTDTTWGLFSDNGKMMSTIVTCPKVLWFDGHALDCDELHMVGSLPENRGGGNIRRMMGVVLRAFREKGDPFLILMPFSFRFYRKFGFELAECKMTQKAKIHQFAQFACNYTIQQVASQEDVNTVRALHDAFFRSRNFVEIKNEENWKFTGNGEFGKRDWWYGDKQHYTYLFLDEEGNAHAYLTFIFKEGPEGPFVGSMQVLDIAFDTPEALRNIFGFIHGMLAKITEVEFTFPRELDLALLLPEGDDVERRISGHLMGRILNVEKVLVLMRHPKGEGHYCIQVIDQFLPENTGIYKVTYRDGKVLSVDKTGEEPDLTVTVETFLQLAIGLADLDAGLFREGTSLHGNEETLKQVFTHKSL